MKAVHAFLVFLSTCPVASAQTAPTLKVGAKTYSISDLLKRPDIEDITVRSDPAYKGQEMHYKATEGCQGRPWSKTISKDLFCVSYHE
jgi:hypothetical protein